MYGGHKKSVSPAPLPSHQEVKFGGQKQGLLNSNLLHIDHSRSLLDDDDGLGPIDCIDLTTQELRLD